MVSVDVGDSWALGFAHNSWQLSPGETIPIQLIFDNRKKFHVFGEVVNSNFVKVPMPVDSELIGQFRWAQVMTAFAKGRLYGFNLTGTSKLLPALVGCMTANKGKFDTAWQADTEQSTGQPTPTYALSPAQLVEAMSLATNFMLGAQLANPKILSKEETPAGLASLGVGWRSDEASGAVMVVPPTPGLKGLDVASAVANGTSNDCKGKFAAGRDSELVDSEVVFRGFATCDDTAGLRTTQFFVVPREKGGFVIFSVFTGGIYGSNDDTTAPDEDLGGYQRAALTAVE